MYLVDSKLLTSHDTVWNQNLLRKLYIKAEHCFTLIHSFKQVVLCGWDSNLEGSMRENNSHPKSRCMSLAVDSVSRFGRWLHPHL